MSYWNKPHHPVFVMQDTVKVIACDGEYVETRLMNSGPKTNPWMQDSVSIFAWGVAWIQSMKNQSVLHSCIH